MKRIGDNSRIEKNSHNPIEETNWDNQKEFNSWTWNKEHNAYEIFWGEKNWDDQQKDFDIFDIQITEQGWWKIQRKISSVGKKFEVDFSIQNDTRDKLLKLSISGDGNMA